MKVSPHFLALSAIFFLLNTSNLAYGKISKKIIDEKLEVFVEQIRPHRAEIRKLVKNAITDRQLGRAEYVTCELCYPIFQLIRPLLQLGSTDEDLVLAISKACQILNLAPTDDVCYPTIKAYSTPMLYLVRNRPSMTNDDFCGIINPGCGKVNSTFLNWKINIKGDKPSYIEQVKLNASEIKATKIIQFTDIHLDLDYAVGYNAECDNPICCRKEDGLPTNASMGGGKYGHYKCALPLVALKEMYSHAKETHPDVKYIFLTGDYIHSGIWLYGVDENTRHITEVTKVLKETFPDTPIFPLSGNHETDIVNMYPPPQIWNEFPLEWMYNAISEGFEQNFGGADQLKNFKLGGFYTVSPMPGFRIIVLNTNICYVQNFWLPYDPVDPNGQLQWFSDVMEKAENASEKVYILSHISPGSGSCWPVWSAQYARIIRRYANIVRAQFHGHSHNEYFVLTFDEAKSVEERKPILTSYVAPSGLTDGMNSGYTVYYVDGERGKESTWQVLNQETYILNTTASNEKNEPVWIKEHSFIDDFKMSSLRPSDYLDLVKRMVNDRELFEKFKMINLKSSNNYEACGETDVNCVSGLLCDTMVAENGDETMCEMIRTMVQEAIFPSDKDGSNLASYGSLLLFLTTIFPFFFN